MVETSSDRSGIQVIARAAAILRALEAEPDGLSLGDIAQRVDLPRSTVQRIVGALTAEQLLSAASAAARVRLGPALVRLGAASSVDVGEVAHSLLEDLSKRVGETVDLSVLSGNTAVFVAQVSGSHRLRAVSAVGDSFPLHCTANGKAILAALPEPRRTRLLDGEIRRSKSGKAVDVDGLYAELEAVRASGLAWDREEHTAGISAVGTAFADENGQLYAISIPVPALRFEQIEQSLLAPLLHTRRELVEKIRGKIIYPI